MRRKSGQILNFKLAKLNFVYAHIEKKLYAEMDEREENTNLWEVMSGDSEKERARAPRIVVQRHGEFQKNSAEIFGRFLADEKRAGDQFRLATLLISESFSLPSCVMT